jgi:hypothetical protein
MKFKQGFVLLLFLCITLHQVSGQLTSQNAVKGMLRGINIGNTMEPPTEGAWGNKPVTNHAFKDYKNAGFTAIRIPITWDLHTSKTSPYTIDPVWLAHVEQIVDDGLSNGLYIIINAHHEVWIKDSFSETNVQRFDSIWRQIAVKLSGKSDHLLFEIINEPNHLTLSNINSLNKQVLHIIRQSNPTRIVAFSGNGYSNSGELLAADIPDANDNYLIGYYHSYDPYPFGLVGTGTYGSETDISKTKQKFDQVKEWSVTNKIPVILGEFGYMKNCDYNSRMCAYATAVEMAFDSGIPAFAWDDNGDFPIYNRTTGGFNEIKDILIHTFKESPDKMEIRILNDAKLQIQWTNRTNLNDSILVERKVDNGEFTPLAKIAPTASRYTDSTTSAGKTYYYRLSTKLRDSIEIQSYPIMMKVSTTN